MLNVPEYNMDFPVVITEDDVMTTEVQWFRKQLKRIAGKNAHGGQNLELRWAVTYRDPMSADNNIKYLDFVQYGRQFGERRFIIEVHRSPEFLKRSGRYQTLRASDDVREFYFCKACEAEIKCSQATLDLLGSVPPCPKCGSNRSRTELIRETEGRLLNEFPSEGCYDYWLRLERANLTYHPPDGEALKVVQALWAWEQMPQNERDALEQADREIERRQMLLAQRQQSGNAPQFGSGLIVPPSNLITV